MYQIAMAFNGKFLKVMYLFTTMSWKCFLLPIEDLLIIYYDLKIVNHINTP